MVMDRLMRSARPAPTQVHAQSMALSAMVVEYEQFINFFVCLLIPFNFFVSFINFSFLGFFH